MTNNMRHNIVAAATIALSISCVALAGSSAMAQEANPPAQPSAQTADAGAANYKRLASLRSSIASLRQELESPNLSADARTNLQRDLSMLSNDMKDYAAERASTTERIPVDQSLLQAASRAALLRSAPTADRPTYLVSQYIESVKTELRERGSGVDISFEAPLSFVRITGLKWEVEEAKLAFRTVLPQYLERVGQLEEAERADILDREKLQLWNFERSTVTIDWKGGRLADLISVVGKSHPCNVILGDPSLGDLVVPPFSVALVRPEALFKSLGLLPLKDDVRLIVGVVTGDQEADSAEKPLNAAGAARMQPLPVIVINRPPEVKPVIRQRIFNLHELPDESDEGIEALIQAIDVAMEASGCAAAVKVRYEARSKLLFAKGPLEAVGLIEELVEMRK